MCCGRLGEQLADLDAALAVLRELERRAHGRAGLALGAQIAAGQRLAVILVQQRLGIERVDLRRPAVHEQVHDLLGLAGKVRRLGRQRSAAPPAVAARRAAQQPVGGQHAGQAQHAEAHAAAGEHLAAGERRRLCDRHGPS